MAPHILQLFHGGSVVRNFLKKLWRFFQEPDAGHDENFDDWTQRVTW